MRWQLGKCADSYFVKRKDAGFLCRDFRGLYLSKSEIPEIEVFRSQSSAHAQIAFLEAMYHEAQGEMK